MSALKRLLFVDTNIWLDFYRARSEAGLSLLNHLEAVSDKIIVSFQLEMEFKKNRHSAIQEGMRELKPPQNISRPGLFSDAKAVKAMQKDLKLAEARVKSLINRYAKALKNPAACDPVYQITQRIFHKGDALSLSRDNAQRHIIKRRAFRRFILGCPPRKSSDTSIGDAVNWEWMINCAIAAKSGLVIVSRDSDYGITYENKGYINDHLKQEFGDRVSNKREILLFGKLSDALKHFEVPITNDEEVEEDLLIKTKDTDILSEIPMISPEQIEKFFKTYSRLSTQSSDPKKGSVP